jgi:hypothetical protein
MMRVIKMYELIIEVHGSLVDKMRFVTKSKADIVGESMAIVLSNLSVIAGFKITLVSDFQAYGRVTMGYWDEKGAGNGAWFWTSTIVK